MSVPTAEIKRTDQRICGSAKLLVYGVLSSAEFLTIRQRRLDGAEVTTASTAVSTTTPRTGGNAARHAGRWRRRRHPDRQRREPTPCRRHRQQRRVHGRRPQRPPGRSRRILPASSRCPDRVDQVCAHHSGAMPGYRGRSRVSSGGSKRNRPPRYGPVKVAKESVSRTPTVPVSTTENVSGRTRDGLLQCRRHRRDKTVLARLPRELPYLDQPASSARGIICGITADGGNRPSTQSVVTSSFPGQNRSALPHHFHRPARFFGSLKQTPGIVRAFLENGPVATVE